MQIKFISIDYNFNFGTYDTVFCIDESKFLSLKILCKFIRGIYSHTYENGKKPVIIVYTEKYYLEQRHFDYIGANLFNAYNEFNNKSITKLDQFKYFYDFVYSIYKKYR